MKDNFPKYDLYEIGCLSYNKLIGERLLNELLENNITGFSLKEYNKFSIS